MCSCPKRSVFGLMIGDCGMPSEAWTTAIVGRSASVSSAVHRLIRQAARTAADVEVPGRGGHAKAARRRIRLGDPIRARSGRRTESSTVNQRVCRLPLKYIHPRTADLAELPSTDMPSAVFAMMLLSSVGLELVRTRMPVPAAAALPYTVLLRIRAQGFGELADSRVSRPR